MSLIQRIKLFVDGRALKDLNKDLDDFGGAVDGANKKGKDFGKGLSSTSKETQAFGDAFDAANDRLAKFGGRFGDVRSRLGEVEDAFKVFTGFALFELGEALFDAAKKIYEWTDAGKAAKIAAEAQAAAIGSVVGKMTSLSQVTRVATEDIFRLISAQISQEAASKGLIETSAQILEYQTEYAETLRELARLKEQGLGLDTFNHRMGTAIAGQQTILARRAAYLHDKLVELNKQFESQKAALGGATQLIQSLTQTIDKAGGAAKKAKEEVRGLTVAFEEVGRLMEETGNAYVVYDGQVEMLNKQTEGVSQLTEGWKLFVEVVKEAGKAIGRTVGKIGKEMDKTVSQWEEGISGAKTMVNSFGQAMANNIANALLYGESVQQAAAMALIGLRDQALGEAIFQVAKGFAYTAAAVVDPKMAVAATSAFSSAAVFAGMAAVSGIAGGALGGGGGGAGTGSANTSPNTRDTAEPPQYSDGGGSSRTANTVVNISYRNTRPLATRREIQDDVAKAINGASTRRSAIKIRSDRIRRR